MLARGTRGSRRAGKRGSRGIMDHAAPLVRVLWCAWLGALFGAPPVLSLEGVLPNSGYALVFSDLRMVMTVCGVLGIAGGGYLRDVIDRRRLHGLLLVCDAGAGGLYVAASWGMATGWIAGGPDEPLPLVASVVLGVLGTSLAGVASLCHAALFAWLPSGRRAPEAVAERRPSAQELPRHSLASRICAFVPFSSAFLLAWGLMPAGARAFPGWTVLRASLAQAFPLSDHEWWQIVFYVIPPGLSGTIGPFVLRLGAADIDMQSIVPMAAWMLGPLCLVAVGSAVSRLVPSGRGSVAPLLAALFLGAYTCWVACCAWPTLMLWLALSWWRLVAAAAALMLGAVLVPVVSRRRPGTGALCPKGTCRSGTGAPCAADACRPGACIPHAVGDRAPVSHHEARDGRGVSPSMGFRDDGAAAALAERGGFSAREAQAVTLRLRGLSSAAVAGRMGISPSTVRNLQARACRKLGVSSFGELADWAGDLGEQAGRTGDAASRTSGSGRSACRAGGASVLRRGSSDEGICRAQGSMAASSEVPRYCAPALMRALLPDILVGALALAFILVPLGPADPDASPLRWQRPFIRFAALFAAVLWLVAWRWVSNRGVRGLGRWTLHFRALHVVLCVAVGMGWGMALDATVPLAMVPRAPAVGVLALLFAGLVAHMSVEFDRVGRTRVPVPWSGAGWLLVAAGALMGSLASWCLFSAQRVLVLLNQGERAVRLASAAGWVEGGLGLLAFGALVFVALDALRRYQAGGLSDGEGAAGRPVTDERVRAYLVSRGLGETQIEVMMMTMAGASRSEIARRLTIAVGTVNSSRYMAYRALGVHTRAGFRDAVLRGLSQ